jgi:alcohol dehydrogenase class IV
MAEVAYQSLPSKVIFGEGTLARAPEAVAELGVRRALVIATRSQAGPAERLKSALGETAAAAFDGAAMHTPVEVTARAMALVESARIDGLIALGGGSAIGLAKAIALRTDLPQIVIPTTYAGSEMTPVVGQTEGGIKTTQRSLKVLPECVIYDVELTLGLPLATSVTSGFNAMAHGVEALYSRTANPLLAAVAEDCVRAVAHALPRIAGHPGDKAARGRALEGAWLGGWSLANGGSALHHKLCHILGGAFGLPHAETHTVLLPHVLAYNAPAAPEAIDRLRRALGVDDPAKQLFDLAQSLGAPPSLKAIGMPEDGAARAVDLAIADAGWNPRPLERSSMLAMLGRAFRGESPRHG